MPLQVTLHNLKPNYDPGLAVLTVGNSKQVFLAKAYMPVECKLFTVRSLDYTEYLRHWLCKENDAIEILHTVFHCC